MHYHSDLIDKVFWLFDENFGKIEFLSMFQSFYNQTFKSITIQHAFKSNKQKIFNPHIVFDKTREKQAYRAQTAFRTSFSPLFLLHQCNSPEPVSVLRYRQNL